MGTGRIAYALFALSGCATTQTTPAPQTDRIVVADADRTIHSHEDIPITAVTVKSKPDVVLPILRASYEELGIKVQVFEATGTGFGQVGNRYFIKSFKLGDTPLSRYLECGNTITGPAADNYKITMSIFSVVSPSGTGSNVQTHVAARADDVAAGGASLSCRSIGTLEAALHRVLVRRLGE